MKLRLGKYIGPIAAPKNRRHETKEPVYQLR